MWLETPTCKEIIQSAWESNISRNALYGVCSNLHKCRSKLTSWSRDSSSNNRKELIRAKEKLRHIVKPRMTLADVIEERHLKAKIQELWTREDIYWKQKSRVKWLMEGYQNTLLLPFKYDFEMEEESHMPFEKHAWGLDKQ